MNNLNIWLRSTSYKEYELSIASADASFRKYYRISKDKKSFIVMDSSLELKSLKPFLNVTSKLLNAGIKAPKIYEKNLKLGYLILEDFGDVNLLDVLNRDNFQTFYLNAIKNIIKIQNTKTSNLPIYDKKILHFEMDLMSEWYLQKKLNFKPNDKDEELISKSLNTISEVVLSQPQGIFVHRDFHSRNLMLISKDEIGIIDYQDAMSGAITYDLVSLLKDCYIEFDSQEIEKLALIFRDKKELNVSDKEFIKWFDFTGLQRHIKVLGIFSRLAIRDKKESYIKDIPLVLKYVIDTAKKYDETKELAQFLQGLNK